MRPRRRRVALALDGDVVVVVEGGDAGGLGRPGTIIPTCLRTCCR